MNKNKISDFLTPDISYLLGLITGRGEIQSANDVKKIVIDFQYKALASKAITKIFDQKLHIQTSLDPIIYRLQNLGINTRKNVTDTNISVTLTWDTDDILWMFIKFLINGTRFNYHDFAVPEPIFETTDDNKREFLRGLCDVTAYVRKSNNNQAGKNRVYIEISNRNCGRWNVSKLSLARYRSAFFIGPRKVVTANFERRHCRNHCTGVTLGVCAALFDMPTVRPHRLAD